MTLLALAFAAAPSRAEPRHVSIAQDHVLDIEAFSADLASMAHLFPPTLRPLTQPAPPRAHASRAATE